MSVRVVARIRPLLKLELDKDTIVTAAASGSEAAGSPTVVKIPNPKNESEYFSFQFNSVYDHHATQQDVFDTEVAPTVKHLFNGFDVTLFAYGVTGTGKTHTMRGGKSLADRGVIPRLLSNVYRRSRKIEKDTAGETQVEVSMSYYEIYNDRVYDLFEPPEKRTLAGLPIRDNNGKTMVVGLTERPCTTLKEFEQLYDQANVNRSTSATKLNAHSSRSHAILCVKITQTSSSHTLISTASAIDLAGSEDNRRTDNNRDRLVESASINKSLFVLAQCVEAISKKQSRIPYRESKMTRILSLGQNNGLTIMILNLAPVRSYHLDTLSSLNFANRTKKIEVNEVENEPLVRGAAGKSTKEISGPSIQRQPLRPLMTANTMNIPETEKRDKPVKAFSVYSDKSRNGDRPSGGAGVGKRVEPQKRTLDPSGTVPARPTKAIRPSDGSRVGRPTTETGLSKAAIEEFIDRRLDEKLAEKALNEHAKPALAINTDVQRRLDALEQKVADREDSEGVQYLLMAKQHAARGEDASALTMYRLAQPFFPHNEKLRRKIAVAEERVRSKREARQQSFADTSVAPIHQSSCAPEPVPAAMPLKKSKKLHEDLDDDDYEEVPQPEADDDEYASDDGFRFKPKRKAQKPRLPVFRDDTSDPAAQTPRTQNLLRIINTRDLNQIRLLKGVGAKKAEAIVNCLCEMDEGDEGRLITDLEQLGALRGVGVKTVENMRVGIAL